MSHIFGSLGTDVTIVTHGEELLSCLANTVDQVASGGCTSTRP